MSWREKIDRLLDRIQDEKLLERIYSMVNHLFVRS